MILQIIYDAIFRKKIPTNYANLYLLVLNNPFCEGIFNIGDTNQSCSLSKQLGIFRLFQSCSVIYLLFFSSSKQAIISIAIEDGNYLQEAWEHVLTCLSRFEHLHLLGEGVPTDASFLTVPIVESEGKNQISGSVVPPKRANALQNPAMMAAVRGGSYDSTVAKTSASDMASPEQINNFISNIHLLDQIGIVELNHIFAHSQRLNSDAIVAFVKALCKVSMTELQSPSDPRIFCLTKIVEIA
jgi:brefeldin A-inhibited guanine nucleotide-exchange protein